MVEQLWTVSATLLTDAASEIVPPKLDLLVKPTESVPDAPESKLDGVITDMMKSPTSTIGEIKCVEVPSEATAVSLRLYPPGVLEARLHWTGTVLFAEIVMGPDGHVTVSPAVVDSVMVTLPEKLSVLFSTKVRDCDCCPELKLKRDGPEIEKSPTCISVVAE